VVYLGFLFNFAFLLFNFLAVCVPAAPLVKLSALIETEKRKCKSGWSQTVITLSSFLILPF